jgi:hypothetical protein
MAADEFYRDQNLWFSRILKAYRMPVLWSLHTSAGFNLTVAR